MAQDTCEVYCNNEEKVKRVKEQLAAASTEPAASIFKALADDTRVKVAFALCQEDELCVCDVANIVGSTIATVSHHLRLLRNMGLARSRKEGKLVFYSIDDTHVKQLILLALERGKEQKVRHK